MGNFKQAKVLMPFSHIILENAFLSQIKDSCVIISFSVFFSFLLPSQREGGCITNPSIRFSTLSSRAKRQEVVPRLHGVSQDRSESGCLDVYPRLYLNSLPAHTPQELTQESRGQNHPQHHSQPGVFKYPGILTGVPVVWLQEQTHSGHASIVFLLARFLLPRSKPLPDQLPCACMHLIKQRSHLADGSGLFKFRSFNLVRPASTSAGLWRRKAKAAAVAQAGPRYIQRSGSAPDPSPCAFDKPQTEPRLCWALLLSP